MKKTETTYLKASRVRGVDRQRWQRNRGESLEVRVSESEFKKVESIREVDRRLGSEANRRCGFKVDRQLGSSTKWVSW